MADEKVIRISAQDTGFGQAINRMAEDAKKALSNIGLDGLFEDVDKQFDKLEDKIKAIKAELAKENKEASEYFDTRRGKATNDYAKRVVDKDEGDYNKRSDKASSAIDKLTEALRKKVGTDDDSGGTDSGGGMVGRTIGRLIGRNVGGLLPGGMGQAVGNAGEAIGGRIAGGAAGAGGAGAGGAGGLIAAGAVAGVVVAVAAAMKMLYGMGMDDWRKESEVSATFDINRDTFGRMARGGGGRASDFGLDNDDYKMQILRISKERGQAYDKNGNYVAEDVAYNQLAIQKGYGLNDQEVGRFNKFNNQDTTQRDASRIIVDLLSRSEKQGILGVSGRDFSRLPEKLDVMNTIMTQQKMSGEKVDSSTAIDLVMAGQKIGGRFGDDRAGEVFGRIGESIKNPDNPGMKAYMFEMLRRANPNASYTDIQGMMENGASRENLQAVLPEISKMPKGEMRRMMLYKLTKNWQDANRLDDTNGLDEMLGALKTGTISDVDAKKKFGETDVRVERNLAALDELGKIIKNNLTDFGEKYIARPINDMSRGIGKGNAADINNAMGTLSGMPWLHPGGYNGNTGANENNTIPKPNNQ